MLVLHAYPLILGLATVAACAAAGPWPYVLIVWLLAGNAAIDAWAPRAPSARPADAKDESLAARILPALALPMVAAVLAAGLWSAGRETLALWERIGVVLAMGFSSGSLGITAAHELVHRKSAWERASGVALLLFVHLPHFRIEHVHNHHPNVGTPLDPATARRGESVYAFIPRSVAGQYLSAWRIENARLRRRGKAAFGPENRMVQYLALQLALDAAVAAAFGWLGLALFAIQGLYAVSVLETVNYIEHYGLARRETAPGRYAPMTHSHAWNSAHAATDFGLFNLGRHSAHHMEIHRPYRALYVLPGAPELPAGYAGAFALALVPPLWRRVMDRRLDALQDRAALAAE